MSTFTKPTQRSAIESLLSHAPLSVRDFGAIGDGVTDDSAALNAAAAAAQATNTPLVFEPGKTYLVNSEFQLLPGSTNYVVRLIGQGAQIKAGRAIRSCMAIVGSQAIVQSLFFWGAREASYCVFMSKASSSRFTGCDAYQGLIDGFHQDFECDRIKYTDCRFQLNGQLFHTASYAGPSAANIRVAVTGTVAKTSGFSCIITGTRTSFLAMGARAGDFVSVGTAPGGPTAEWLQIESVDSDTQITCTLHPPSAAQASGLEYSIHVGNGVHEGPGRADNNICIHDNCLYRNNAGCGYMIHGLYGPRVNMPQSDANGAYPIAVSYATLVTIGTVITGGYYELNGAADNVFLGYAADVLIDQANGKGQPVLSNPGFAWGVIRGMQNATDPGRIDPIGANPVDYVPSGVLAPDVLARGRIRGQNYAQNGPGGGSLTMRDSLNPAWAAVSGAGAGGADPNVVGFDFDTAMAVNNGIGEVDSPTKHLARFRNAGGFKFGIGFEGDVRTAASDASGSPGAATIDKPSGRFAMAAGASAVIVSNKLVNVSTKVFLSKLHNDITAVDFKVTTVNGSFTVTANANSTAMIGFDFFIVNIS